MPFEFSFLDWLNKNLTGNDFINKVFKYITFLGDKGFVWIAIGLILICLKKYRPQGVLLLGALAVGAITNSILKEVVQRTRPIYVEGHGNLFDFAKDYLLTSRPISYLFDMPEETSYSFASGHTYSSFNAALILYFTNKKLGYAGYALATLIAFSRLFFGVHYPTDVLAGIILGTATALLSIYIYKKILKYFEIRKKAKCESINT